MGGDSKIFMADFCGKILRKSGSTTQRLQKHLVTTWSLTVTSCHVMQLDMLRKSVQPNVKLSFGEGGLMLTATNIRDQFENTSASILKSQREAIEFWKEAVSIVCSIAASAYKKVTMRVQDA